MKSAAGVPVRSKRKRETGPRAAQSFVHVQNMFTAKNQLDHSSKRSRHADAPSETPSEKLAPDSIHCAAIARQKSSQVTPTVTVTQAVFPPAYTTQPAEESCKPESYSLSRTAVMFRLHAPTQSMFNRVLEAFGAASAMGMTFVASVDCTLAPGKTIYHRLIDEIGSKHVHSYVETDMIASYPVLHAMRERVTEVCRKVQWDWTLDSNGQLARSLAWGFHAECISLWVQKQIREAARVEKSLPWDYLWVLEDDIGKYSERR